MDLAKDIFFFIGSLLGILAFLINLIIPSLHKNKDKWRILQNHLTGDDLIGLEFDLSVRRRVDIDLLDKFYSFSRDIERNVEYLRFGHPFKKRFAQKKEEIVKLSNQLRSYIQSPQWELMYDQNMWVLNKDFFYEEFDSEGKEYTNHLKEVSETVNEIKSQYKAMSYLADLQILEIPKALFRE